MLALLLQVDPSLVVAPPMVAPPPNSGVLGHFVSYVVPVLVTAILGFLGRLLHNRSGEAKAQKEKTLTDELLSRLLHLADIVYAELVREAGPLIQRITEDGKVTEEEWKFVEGSIIEHFRRYLGDHGLKEVTKTLGIPDNFVTSYLAGLVRSLLVAKRTA